MEVIGFNERFILGRDEAGKVYICEVSSMPPGWVEIMVDDPRMVVPSSSEVDLAEILGTYERKPPEEF